MSVLADFFKLLKDAMEEYGLPEIWPELEYRGGNPADVRQRLMELAEGSDTEIQQANDLIGLAVTIMHFGPKPTIQGLSASKANRFSEEARRVMAWGANTFNKYKDKVPGLTANSITAAFPEICLVFASHTGSTGRPLPGLLQLPLSDDLRLALEKSISAKISPNGDVTDASKIASTLQRQNPIREFPTAAIFLKKWTETNEPRKNPCLVGL